MINLACLGRVYAIVGMLHSAVTKRQFVSAHLEISAYVNVIIAWLFKRQVFKRVNPILKHYYNIPVSAIF